VKIVIWFQFWFIHVIASKAMGQKPTEEELFQMISEVDENMSGSIDFAEFLKVIENQKERAENFDGNWLHAYTSYVLNT